MRCDRSGTGLQRSLRRCPPLTSRALFRLPTPCGLRCAPLRLALFHQVDSQQDRFLTAPALLTACCSCRSGRRARLPQANKLVSARISRPSAQRSLAAPVLPWSFRSATVPAAFACASAQRLCSRQGAPDGLVRFSILLSCANAVCGVAVYFRPLALDTASSFASGPSFSYFDVFFGARSRSASCGMALIFCASAFSERPKRRVPLLRVLGKPIRCLRPYREIWSARSPPTVETSLPVRRCLALIAS